MPDDKRAFYEYHASLMEPWDGPAAVAFTDGKSYQFMASQMTGMEEKDYVAMMLAGGRSPDGWRSKSERKGKD